jgi:hypothetical protein
MSPFALFRTKIIVSDMLGYGSVEVSLLQRLSMSQALSTRQLKFIQTKLKGKSNARAAREAGYAESVARRTAQEKIRPILRGRRGTPSVVSSWVARIAANMPCCGLLLGTSTELHSEWLGVADTLCLHPASSDHHSRLSGSRNVLVAIASRHSNGWCVF